MCVAADVGVDAVGGGGMISIKLLIMCTACLQVAVLHACDAPFSVHALLAFPLTQS